MLNESLLEPSSSQDSSNNVGELYTVGSSSSTNNDASTTASSSLLGTGSGVGDYEADAAAGGIKQSPTSPTTALQHSGGSEKKLSAFVLAVIIFFNAAGKHIISLLVCLCASYCNLCIICAALTNCNWFSNILSSNLW